MFFFFQGPSGFRSAQNVGNGGQLQQDFESFVNSGPVSAAPSLGPGVFSQPNVMQNIHNPRQQQNISQMNDWANDFTKLNISHSSPLPQVQQSNRPVVSSTNGWQNQFLQQQQQQHQGSNFQQQSSVYTGYQGYTSQLSSSNTLGLSSGQPQDVSNASVSREAEMKLFEAAFDNVEKELNAKEKGKVESNVQHDNILPQTVEETNTSKDTTIPSDENAELSRIAQHIVTNIDRQNDKLKNSNFMMLMEQLSKNQVKLEDEKFIDTETGSDIRDQYSDASLQSARLNVSEESSTDQRIPQNIPQETTLPIHSNTSEANHGEQRLQDPLELLSGEGDSNDILSSFEMARKIAPDIVDSSKWEENYDDVVI